MVQNSGLSSLKKQNLSETSKQGIKIHIGLKRVVSPWPLNMWKLIGIFILLGATPAPSLVLIKLKGKNILSGQHSRLRRVVWPWPLNMWPENQKVSSTYWGQHLHQVWCWSNDQVWSGQKILSGQHFVYRPTYRPTDQPTYRPTDRSCKTIWSLLKGGGHKNRHFRNPEDLIFPETKRWG